MIKINNVSQLQEKLQQLRLEGKKIGFVPTMGNLHQGHLSLVEQAKIHANIVVVSLFVNPTQFGPNEDFDAYPRTLEQDCEKLESKGTDIVFAPSTQEVYPSWPNLTSINVEKLDQLHCGASRAGHFSGVCTVVAKLFNMVRPDVAIFGEKDFQQLQIIKRMTVDLNFPIQIVGAPIVRETNGLAMSSRNGYLSISEKEQASQLYQALLWAQSELESGLQDFRELEKTLIERLNAQGFAVDYFNITRRSDLQLATAEDKEVVLLIAATINAQSKKVRLIDNLQLGL